MEKALNTQVSRELCSAYLYLAMSSYFVNVNMKGFARWMRVQVKEEQVHALKIYDYIVARGGIVSLPDIESPKAKGSSAGKVFDVTPMNRRSPL